MTAPFNHETIHTIGPLSLPIAGFIDTVKMNNNLNASFMRHADVNQKDAYGFTALYWAVSHHNMHNLEILMYFGATLEVSTHRNALFYAIECDNIEALKYFIEKGINKNITLSTNSKQSYTLLEYAQKLHRKAFIKYLL